MWAGGQQSGAAADQGEPEEGPGGSLDTGLVVESVIISLLTFSPAHGLAPLGFGKGENSSWELEAPDHRYLISNP